MADGEEMLLSAGSEYIYDFYCELCIDDDIRVEARGYCVNCKEYLCGNCYNGHKSTRSTRRHVLLDSDNMPKDTPLSSDRVKFDIATMCKSHSAKLVEFYCRSHDILGCSTCFATVHKVCPNVDSILENSQHVFDSQDYKKFIVKLETMKTKSEEMTKLSRDNKTLIQKCCLDAISSVRQVKEQVLLKLNEIESSIVAKAEEICLENEEQMDNLIKECTDMSIRIEELSSQFARLQSSQRVCQAYIKMREDDVVVNEMQVCLQKAEITNVVKSFMFEHNSELKDYFMSSDALGKILYQDSEETDKYIINLFAVVAHTVDRLENSVFNRHHFE